MDERAWEYVFSHNDFYSQLTDKLGHISYPDYGCGYRDETRYKLGQLERYLEALKVIL